MAEEPKTYRVSPVQIVMVEAMEVLRGGSFTRQEIAERLLDPKMANLLDEALTRAAKVGAVTNEAGKWKLIQGNERPSEPRRA